MFYCFLVLAFRPACLYLNQNLLSRLKFVFKFFYLQLVITTLCCLLCEQLSRFYFLVVDSSLQLTILLN